MCYKTADINENLLESFQYPKGEFPVLRTKKSLDEYKQGEISCHWHSEFQFGLLLQEKLDYYIFNNPVSKLHHTLNPGDGFFINSRVLHGYRQTVPGSSLFLFSMIPSFFASPPFGKLYQKIILPVMHSKKNGLFLMSDQQEDTLMLRLFRKFKSLCPKEQDYELHAMEVICRIWQSLFHKFESGDLLADPSLKNISHMTRMHKMLDFIHENYSKPMTVEQIADAGHISKRECFRCFRAVINQSPIEYLIQYHLTMAANLLMSSDKPLSAISESCGFENTSYFTKCFKKRYGILPREFRS